MGVLSEMRQKARANLGFNEKWLKEFRSLIRDGGWFRHLGRQ